MMNWYDKYINIPYENRGREATGSDCWGLAIQIYKNELGIDLPGYSDISAENLLQIYHAMNTDKDSEIWESVNPEDIQAFDICVMRGAGIRRVCHAGIVLDKKRIIHMEKGVDSCIVTLDHFSIRERIDCYRRHKHLSAKLLQFTESLSN